MISTLARNPGLKKQRQNMVRQISSLRGQMDDLNDYLDLIEARARNVDKPVHSADEVRKRFGFK